MSKYLYELMNDKPRKQIVMCAHLTTSPVEQHNMEISPALQGHLDGLQILTALRTPGHATMGESHIISWRVEC